MRLLVGQLDYLNTRPFEPLPEVRTVRATASEIGRLAAAGEVDAGLLSVVDLFRCEDRYAALEEAGGPFGIACRRRAGSVFLLSRCPPAELAGKTVEITRETSTSVLLLRLFLERRLGIAGIRYRRGVTRQHAAALLIADQALRERERPDPAFPWRFDLATCWREWTGLPFVFAIWCARRALTAGARRGFAGALAATLAEGVRRIPAIAAEAAGSLGDRDTVAAYLAEFTYRFGERERAGLDRFRRLAREENLIGSPLPNQAVGSGRPGATKRSRR